MTDKITIEQVKKLAEDKTTAGKVVFNMNAPAIAQLAIAQAEEIERLREFIEDVRNIYPEIEEWKDYPETQKEQNNDR